jgi:hypothetical protein
MGAEVGKHRRAMRSGQRVGKIEHHDIFERHFHRVFVPGVVAWPITVSAPRILLAAHPLVRPLVPAPARGESPAFRSDADTLARPLATFSQELFHDR